MPELIFFSQTTIIHFKHTLLPIATNNVLYFHKSNHDKSSLLIAIYVSIFHMTMNFFENAISISENGKVNGKWKRDFSIIQHHTILTQTFVELRTLGKK